MNNGLRMAADGGVVSSEGWAVHLLGPDLLEYCHGRVACLVNMAYAPAQNARQVYASESTSDLFPRLREHLQSAMGFFKGNYVVV